MEEVRKLLKDLDTFKAPGPDGIHLQVIREMRDVLAKPLTTLFNKSSVPSKIPTKWKEANITAIFKKR